MGDNSKNKVLGFGGLIILLLAIAGLSWALAKIKHKRDANQAQLDALCEVCGEDVTGHCAEIQLICHGETEE